MVGVLTAGIGLVGSLIGSFLNVVIFRVPAGRSVAYPASACGSCGARIRPWDNVPVLSWLVLRGACRDCGERISVRYPLIELGTALFFAGIGWWVIETTQVGLTSDALSLASAGLLLAGLLYFAAISIALTMIDLDTHTLPNRIVLPAYPVLAVLLGASALLAGEPERLLTAAIGGAGLFALYFVMAVGFRGGMGFGDVKLAGVLGIVLGQLGWAPLAVGAFSAFLLGGLFSLVLVVVRGANRRTAIPFGPWMLAGAWVGIVAGDAIASAYLGLFGLN